MRPFLFAGLVAVLAAPALAAQARPVSLQTQTVAPGATVRFPFPVDSGRGFQIAVVRDQREASVTAALYEPGRVPSRSDAPLRIGTALEDAPTEFDAADAVAGRYELDVRNTSTTATQVTVRVTQAPVRLGAALAGGDLRITATNLMDTAVAVRFRVGLKGAVMDRRVTGTGAAPLRLAFPMPAWAATAIVDTRMTAMQWVRFAEFTVQLGASPAGAASFPLQGVYGRARQTVTGGDSLVVWLTPRFVEGTPVQSWSIDLQIRYDMAPEVEIDPGGSPMRTAQPGQRATETFPMKPAASRPMPAGFDPLVQIVAIQGPEHDWWRVARLRGGRTP